MSKASDLARLMTSGSTAVHGEAGVTASGSTGLTTNLQQGLAKSWVNFNGTGTIAARDSLNNASLTDNGTGYYTITLTNAMGNANYSCTFGDGEGTSSSGMRFLMDAGSTTSSQEIYGRNVSNSAADCAAASMAIHGDLA